jgi:Fis family transcriptional regulator, factor for inversion stimulation protein
MEPFAAVSYQSSNPISLMWVIRQMRSVETTYSDAFHEFKRHYVVHTLVRNACHLGKTANELGIHPNTMTRTLRELGIDAKEIRKRCPRVLVLKPAETG